MNPPSVSSFFSRDVFLRTRARSNRKRMTHTNLSSSINSVQDTLCMIKEEDEPRASSSSFPSLSQGLSISSCGSQPKLKRRHANIADIQSAVTALLDDPDFIQEDAGLLSSPRPAPRPPVSPPPNPKLSPDPSSHSFFVTSLKSPHSPIFTPSSNHYRTGSESPTPSMSSCSATTSPETRTPPLSMTPSSSDDESFFYHDSPAPFNPAIIKPLVITKHNIPAVSYGSPPSPSRAPPKRPLPPLPIPEDYSDSESDSEWYSRELSKVLTLRSPPLPDPPSKARPDSLCILDNLAITPKPSIPTTRRELPSTQTDPAFARLRNRICIPNYPPPPVPTLPKRISVTPLLAQTSKPCSNLPTVTRRPPPRSSVPADCVLVDDTFAFSDDDASGFSLSLYDHSPLPSARPGSPKSPYSHCFQSPRPSPFPPSFPSTPSTPFPSSAKEEFDFPIEDIRFDMKFNRPVVSSLDFPTSPVDFEADFTSFEQLHKEPRSQTFTPREVSAGDDSRELRSRWSSSTLGSVHEEHTRRNAIGLALRAYFSSPSAKSKNHSSSSGRRPGSGPGSDSIPKTPARKFKQEKWESDVMVIGYAHDAQQHRGHRGKGSS